MKKAIIIVTVLTMAALLASGCAKTRKTHVTPGGEEVTVETEKSIQGDKRTVEVKTEEGTATITTETEQTITEAELGVPVYPGAKVKASSKYEGGKDKFAQHTLVTTDSFEEVQKFYKARLKNVQTSYSATHEGQKTATFVLADDKGTNAVSIASNEEENNTIITVTRTPK